ncbi:MAG: hypothetical protein QOK16_1493 [Solirubrobacteraceae bacterium]|jgi:hypothetical protein|nr:hypothetical protein [Solirubrobacteraceae bacterium]
MTGLLGQGPPAAPPALSHGAELETGLAPGLAADILLVLLAPAALAMWFVSLSGVHIGDIGDHGLVDALPAGAIVALVLLAAGFAVALARNSLRIAVLYVVVLTFALYGALVPIEQVASFNVSWRHAGIADHLARAGGVDPGIDAYFNWPGFFALLALASDAAGVSDPLVFAPWAAVAANLLYLPPLAMIARSAGGDPRLVPLALWVFILSNWVGQDYLSPQALSFGLYLVVLAVVLTWFGGPGSGPASRPRFLRSLRLSIAGERGAPAALPRAGRDAVLLVALAAAATTVPSHQLTPFALVLVLAALVVFGRTWLRGLPLLLTVAIAAWLVFMTISYLSGNIEALKAQLGALTKTLSSSVGARIGGSDGHTQVVNARLVFTGLLWLGALAGAALRLRGGQRTWSLLILFLAPFGLPILQPYGGEIVLRVYLFALPGMAVLVASLWLAFASGHRRQAGAVVFVVTVGLMGAFLITRHGNDRVWLFTRQEASIVNRVYDIAAPGSVLAAPSTTLPWQHRRYAELEHVSLERLKGPIAHDDGGRRLASAVYALIKRQGDGYGYVIVTRSLRAYDKLLGSASWGSVPQLERALDGSSRFRRLISGRDARVWVTVPERTPERRP